jgi:hypothetical protein
MEAPGVTDMPLKVCQCGGRSLASVHFGGRYEFQLFAPYKDEQDQEIGLRPMWRATLAT